MYNCHHISFFFIEYWYFLAMEFFPQEVYLVPVEDVGVPTAGDSYILECTISRVDTLSPSTLLEVVWLDPDNNTITSNTLDYTITGDTSTTSTILISRLTLTRLRTSHAGVYSCSANMTVPGVVTDHQVARTTDVIVTSNKSNIKGGVRVRAVTTFNY